MNARTTPAMNPIGRHARRRGPTILLSLSILALLAIPSGCRTAASMGLPISSGSHGLLSYAAKIRESAGHPKGVPTELAKSSLPPHRMEAGDVLVIEPNDFNSPIRLSSDQTVQQDGTIELGTYGRLQVVGLPIEEIQNQVQTLIAKHEIDRRKANVELASHTGEGSSSPENLDDFGVTVRLVSQESGWFYVMGEVNAPGSYPLVGNETVLDAIILAGGLSDRGNDHKIILTRPQMDGQPRSILPVCYQQILQLGDVSTNYQLQPGDRIYVPSLTIWEDIKQSTRWSKDKSCPHCRDYSGR